MWELLSVAGGLAIEGLVWFWESSLLPALKGIWGFIQDNLIPIFEDIWAFIQDKLIPIIGTLVEGPIADFKTGLQGIKDAVGWVIDKIKILIDWLEKIKVPEILEGHSPSPFETSLRGIGDAMDELNRRQLPALTVGLAGAGGGGTNITYQLNYSGVQSTEENIEGHLDRLMLMRR